MSGALGSFLAETADRGLEAGLVVCSSTIHDSRLTTHDHLACSVRIGTGLTSPDRVAVLADRPVGGELAGARHVQDRHARPARRVAECAVDLALRVDVGAVVGEQQIGVVVEEVIEQRPEQACDRRRRMRRLRSDRAPHAAPHRARSNRAADSRAALSSFTCSAVRPNRKKFSAPTSSRISTLAPSSVPMVSAPLSVNFMLPVPEASLPAVEICSDRSAAG